MDAPYVFQYLVGNVLPISHSYYFNEALVDAFKCKKHT